jgi:hypothetical protein
MKVNVSVGTPSLNVTAAANRTGAPGRTAAARARWSKYAASQQQIHTNNNK